MKEEEWGFFLTEPPHQAIPAKYSAIRKKLKEKEVS